jgi:carbon-monoxide dehydrogenase large subunit
MYEQQLSAPLKEALTKVNYADLRKQQTEARAAGKLMGVGLSTYGEICAMGPSAALPAGGWESATVKIEPTGKVTVLTGASPHGQGEETTFAQIAADERAADRRRAGGPATQRWCSTASDAGSRGMAVGGAALYYALQDPGRCQFGACQVGERPSSGRRMRRPARPSRPPRWRGVSRQNAAEHDWGCGTHF